MGKVDWDEAELWYMSDSRISYAMLATYYKVSKPTIQAHGTKHKWSDKREEFKKKRMDNLLNRFNTDLDKVNEDHLSKYRAMRSVMYALFVDIVRINDEDMYKRSSDVARLSKALNMVIMQERAILGLPVYRKRAETNPLFVNPYVLHDAERVTEEEVRIAKEKFKAHQKRIEQMRSSSKKANETI
jgi:hypothetical protein